MLGEAEARGTQSPSGELPLSLPPLLRQTAAGVALGELLDRLVRSVERAIPDSNASLLLVMNGQLRLGAAPNLPEAYNRTADSLPIGEGFGSCGTAAHRGQLVISPDLQIDPLWRNYREIARHYQLGSCWSMPVHARSGTVVGTLALYGRKPRAPDAHELDVMRDHAALAAMVIECHGTQAALAETADRHQELVRDSQAEVRRREEFLSIAAHELMTPVASLLLTVQTILEGLDRQPPDLEFLRGRAVAGERQAVRLGRLVNELLDVSRIRAGRLELIRADMDLAAAVHAVVGRFRDETARKGIDVAVHAPAPAVGHWDQSRIEQIVSNLLSNAIKYGDQRPVLIALAQDPERVTLEVADRGIGMDPAFIPRLFSPFERGVSAGHYAGLGLGLYIAAQNTEAHGGRIFVRSVPGQGSTFTIELPRRAPD